MGCAVLPEAIKWPDVIESADTSHIKKILITKFSRESGASLTD